jgi:hypothetical protein
VAVTPVSDIAVVVSFTNGSSHWDCAVMRKQEKTAKRNSAKMTASLLQTASRIFSLDAMGEPGVSQGPSR